MSLRVHAAFRIFLIFAVTVFVLLFLSASVVSHAPVSACLLLVPFVLSEIVFVPQYWQSATERRFLLPQTPLLPGTFQRPPPDIS